MLRVLFASSLLLLAACGMSHGPDDDAGSSMDASRDAALPPLGRCPSHCSWDDRCPAAPDVGGSCSGDFGLYCAYCREGSSFDEVTTICRDGRWESGACGCPCP